ncbi:hypothetical protein AAHA92_11209 [Salvia divinorum]|uniref:Uncharacterized protein n=1 Tax=Salvia divinorum TaxID=28513 RepID=A0ABD1HGD3_SALDI
MKITSKVCQVDRAAGRRWCCRCGVSVGGLAGQEPRGALRQQLIPSSSSLRFPDLQLKSCEIKDLVSDCLNW